MTTDPHPARGLFGLLLLSQFPQAQANPRGLVSAGACELPQPLDVIASPSASFLVKHGAKLLADGRRGIKRLHGSGDLPTFRIRSRICARKVTLDRWILEQERAGLAARNGNEA